MKPLKLVATLFLIASFPGLVSADDESETAPVPAGSRVRIETKDGKRVIGTLSSWEADRLVLKGDKETPVVIERTSVAGLEKSIGKTTQGGKGALIGGIAGAVLPMVVVGSVWNSCGNCEGSALEGAGLGLFYLGRYTVPIGMVIGAVIGQVHSKDKWVAVGAREDKPVALGLQLGPAPGRGVAASVSLSWK